MKKKIIIAGITGKTGRIVSKVVSEHYEIVGAIGYKSVGQDIGKILSGEKSNRYVYPNLTSALQEVTADVYIDFTEANAMEQNLENAIHAGLDVIVGTTGLKKEYIEKMGLLIERNNGFGIFASNFAIGVAIILKTGEAIASYYDRENIQIVERHHKSKIDTPSGTAEYLKDKLDLQDGSILSKRVSVKSSLHEISYYSDHERLSISYEVTNPQVYGEGVLFVLNNLDKVSGFYNDLFTFVQEVGEPLDNKYIEG